MAVALAHGEACTACTQHKCVDPPTVDEPAVISINGNAVEIAECPNRYCGPEARQAITFAKYAKRGHLPLDGGILSQTQQCVDAIEWVWTLEDYYDRKRGY